MLDLGDLAPPEDWGVRVDLDAVSRLADEWAGGEFELPSFDYPGTPADRNEQVWFDYVTLAVSVLACLWAPEGHDIWHAEHDGEWLDDAPGIFAAFTRAMFDHGHDVSWFSTMADRDGAELFAGRGTLLLVEERTESLRRTAAAVLTTWHGSVRNLVEHADRNGANIVQLLTDTIPAFSDRPLTLQGQAPFDKLAHLAAAIMAAGAGWSAAGFHGYDTFPVYPDYMLPRVFRHYGAMIYDPALAQAVDSRQVIDKDSTAEHALRWATVFCGAQLTKALAERGTTVTGPALDYRLWSIAVLGPDAASFGEHHRTITLRY